MGLTTRTGSVNTHLRLLGVTGYVSGLRAVTMEYNRLNLARTRTGKILSGMTMAGLGLTTLSVGVVGLGAKVMQLGIHAKESESLFKHSFGRMGDSVRAWSANLSKNIGLNQYELRREAALLNLMLGSMGLDPAESAKISTSLVQRVKDISSFRDIPFEAAFEKVKSGLTGEIRPLRNIGILVDQNSIKMRAQQQGLLRYGGQLTQLQKLRLRYEMIMQATQGPGRDAGDLARTKSDPVNALRLQQEKFAELGTDLGLSLVPLATKLLQFTNSLIPPIKKLADSFAGMSESGKSWALGLAIGTGPALLVMAKVIPMIMRLVKGKQALKLATEADIIAERTKTGVAMMEGRAIAGAGMAAGATAMAGSRLARINAANIIVSRNLSRAMVALSAAQSTGNAAAVAAASAAVAKARAAKAALGGLAITARNDAAIAAMGGTGARSVAWGLIRTTALRLGVYSALIAGGFYVLHKGLQKVNQKVLEPTKARDAKRSDVGYFAIPAMVAAALLNPRALGAMRTAYKFASVGFRRPTFGEGPDIRTVNGIRSVATGRFVSAANARLREADIIARNGLPARFGLRVGKAAVPFAEAFTNGRAGVIAGSRALRFAGYMGKASEQVAKFSKWLAPAIESPLGAVLGKALGIAGIVMTGVDLGKLGYNYGRDLLAVNDPNQLSQTADADEAMGNALPRIKNVLSYLTSYVPSTLGLTGRKGFDEESGMWMHDSIMMQRQISDRYKTEIAGAKTNADKAKVEQFYVDHLRDLGFYTAALAHSRKRASLIQGIETARMNAQQKKEMDDQSWFRMMANKTTAKADLSPEDMANVTWRRGRNGELIPDFEPAIARGYDFNKKPNIEQRRNRSYHVELDIPETQGDRSFNTLRYSNYTPSPT